jgi:hypothetical protein
MAIICSECGENSFVRREPVYDGFKKTGEKIICTSCGHIYDDESLVPFIEKQAPKVFTADDRSKKVRIFKSDEIGHNCHHCDHYTVNPFMQRCGLHGREVDATDTCANFTPKRKNQNIDNDPLANLIKKGTSGKSVGKNFDETH